jgi:hypothetical protein
MSPPRGKFSKALKEHRREGWDSYTKRAQGLGTLQSNSE